jgi:predicted DCC family thiol-disulfide oxidoreductase YuxK
MSDPEIILFFDGVCGLCNGLVDWLLPRDKQKRIKFATLQGTTAARLLSPPLREDLNTVVLWYKGEILTESTAILTCLKELGGLWSLAIVLKIIPSFIRDSIYKIIAKYRYKLFGKLSTCRLPLPGERLQFLD